MSAFWNWSAAGYHWILYLLAVVAFTVCRGAYIILSREDLPGGPARMPASLHDDYWNELDPSQAADQLIAEWHDEGNERWAGDWLAADLDDPDAIVWDAKQQAARCWEILHVEFPRLRAELCGAA